MNTPCHYTVLTPLYSTNDATTHPLFIRLTTRQMHNRVNQTIYVAHDGQEESDIVGVFLDDIEVR